MRKNPMTRTQYRRFQRQKKQEGQKVQAVGKVLPVETAGGKSAVVKQTG
ncbi:hypothetical protein A2U01_0116863, partial [Trifolium medium]|nr:hypothetical protein [Trifolium medium]